MTLPLEGAPGAAAILSVAAHQYFAGLAAYQAIAIGVLVLLLLLGAVLAALTTESEGAVPRALLQPADRIVRGDFSARAPKLAGTAGLIAEALNRAAAAAERPPAEVEPSFVVPPGDEIRSDAQPAAAPDAAGTEPVPATEMERPEPPPAEPPVATRPPAPVAEPASPPVDPAVAAAPISDTEPDAAWSAPGQVEAEDEPSRADAQPGAEPPPPPPEVAAPALVGPAAEPIPAEPSTAAAETPPPAGPEPVPPAAAAEPPAAARLPHADEEVHWRTVFDDFVRVRTETGEGGAAHVSYDRFRSKLEKNREQLVEKYGCRTVRFQVYVKEGKAAVRATPVR